MKSPYQFSVEEAEETPYKVEINISEEQISKNSENLPQEYTVKCYYSQYILTWTAINVNLEKNDNIIKYFYEQELIDYSQQERRETVVEDSRFTLTSIQQFNYKHDDYTKLIRLV